MEIRPADDLREFLRPISVAFGDDPVPDWADRVTTLIDPERAHSAYEDGRIVGSAGAFTFELTVPGGVVPAAGVTVVGVLPSHRRRGILTELMRVQLEDARRRGEPVAYLWASDDRIYGRFGYGLASLTAAIEIATARARFRDDPGRSGRVRLLDKPEALDAIPAIYERVRREWPAMFARPGEWWSTRRLADPREPPGTLFKAVWENDAYALYRVKMDWTPTGSNAVLDVVEALGTTTEATREIWRYLFSVDLVARVRASMLPLGHPLVFLLDEPRALGMRVDDGIWVRLVDVGAALEARARGEGSVVLDVTDAFVPENAGRWRVGGDGVERTDDAPELALGVADLGAVYLGGFTFAELARGGRVRELEPGALARADGIFRWDTKPWCPEIF
jgi:predicted acetyltransferase